MTNKVKENSTHFAVKEKDGTFKVYLKHFDGTECYPNGEKMWTKEDMKKWPHWFKPEFLYYVHHEDDLFEVFERLDENNRCNVAEANAELRRKF